MSTDKQTVAELEIFSSAGQSIVATTACVIREVALTVGINSQALATIACLGDHLDELAAGYLRSEKIVLTGTEIEKIDIDGKQYRVNISLKTGKEYSPNPIRNIASSGARDRNIDPSALKPLSLQDNFVIRAGQALKLMDDLLENSTLHNETHGTHCSALASCENIIALREDIGRHNTIDMLGGYALFKQIDLSATVILTTGRISSEIVFKVWNLGIPVIISHSAPTTKAVDLLRLANITLIGYVRSGRINIYSHERRVII